MKISSLSRQGNHNCTTFCCAFSACCVMKNCRYKFGLWPIKRNPKKMEIAS